VGASIKPAAHPAIPTASRHPLTTLSDPPGRAGFSALPLLFVCSPDWIRLVAWLGRPLFSRRLPDQVLNIAGSSDSGSGAAPRRGAAAAAGPGAEVSILFSDLVSVCFGFLYIFLPCQFIDSPGVDLCVLWPSSLICRLPLLLRHRHWLLLLLSRCPACLAASFFLSFFQGREAAEQDVCECAWKEEN